MRNDDEYAFFIAAGVVKINKNSSSEFVPEIKDHNSPPESYVVFENECMRINEEQARLHSSERLRARENYFNNKDGAQIAEQLDKERKRLKAENDRLAGLSMFQMSQKSSCRDTIQRMMNKIAELESQYQVVKDAAESALESAEKSAPVLINLVSERKKNGYGLYSLLSLTDNESKTSAEKEAIGKMSLIIDYLQNRSDVWITPGQYAETKGESFQKMMRLFQHLYRIGFCQARTVKGKTEYKYNDSDYSSLLPG